MPHAAFPCIHDKWIYSLWSHVLAKLAEVLFSIMQIGVELDYAFRLNCKTGYSTIEDS